MSPTRSSKPSTAKRVPYKPPRPRRELVTGILVGVVIVVVTATLVWFLRPNRESTSTSTPVSTTPTSTVAPTDTTLAPTDTTVPADTGTPETTADTAAASTG